MVPVRFLLTQVLAQVQGKNIKCTFYRVPEHGVFIAKKACIRPHISCENYGAQSNDKTNTVHDEFLKQVVRKQNLQATDIS
jgi:hypothetical protein